MELRHRSSSSFTSIPRCASYCAAWSVVTPPKETYFFRVGAGRKTWQHYSTARQTNFNFYCNNKLLGGASRAALNFKNPSSIERRFTLLHFKVCITYGRRKSRRMDQAPGPDTLQPLTQILQTKLIPNGGDRKRSRGSLIFKCL